MNTRDKQIEVLNTTLQRLLSAPLFINIYLCHQICRAYAGDVPFSPSGWTPLEAEVLRPLRTKILLAIYPCTTVDGYLEHNQIESGKEAARAFRIALLTKLLAELEVES
ncbi:hypothetical protein [Ferribacterium limneticum]|uniref:hypothetical protein n=1 Tax=Ferribacterium limneticum TaxID=76259 RepID=UPI001CF817D8|nr:hypothetical protein [Ferribacterium limneticum]UCV26765.1 hypothetical protein KI617_10630 [Ferribacterium limneticum]UCV30682.1 hypothetical protein KI608_10630 [Ferribacterium limneticum]